MEPVEPPVCVVEPVVVPVLVPDVPFPVVVGTVQPTPPLGAGPVQLDGLPGTVLPGCVVEVEPVVELEPVVEPVVVPLPVVVPVEPEPGDVELPVPVFGPVQPFGPRTCPDGQAPPGRPGPLWPPVVAPEPQTPFT